MSATRCEAGFTLVEIVVVTSLLVVVLGLLMGPLITAPQQATRDINRAWAIRDAQTGLYTMTRELRATQTVYSATATQIDVAVANNGTTQRVVYKCDATVSGQTYLSCVRAASTNLSASPSLTNAPVVINRVLNNTTADPSDPVFAYTPSSALPTYISFKVVVPSNGGYSGGYRRGYSYNVTLNGGAYLRNLGTQ